LRYYRTQYTDSVRIICTRDSVHFSDTCNVVTQMEATG